MSSTSLSRPTNCWLHAFGRAEIVMRRPGRIDVLIARRGVVCVGHGRETRRRFALAWQAIGALHAITTRAFNAGGVRVGNWTVRFSFVRRLYGARGHEASTRGRAKRVPDRYWSGRTGIPVVLVLLIG